MTKRRIFQIIFGQSVEPVTIAYDSEMKLLCSIDIRKISSEKMVDFVFQNTPKKEDEFLEWVQKNPAWEVVELSQEITFEMFWKKYDDASRSSRKRSLLAWNRMSVKNQVAAYFFIDVYMRNKGFAGKKYCETYLSDELWNN